MMYFIQFDTKLHKFFFKIVASIFFTLDVFVFVFFFKTLVTLSHY